MLYDIRSILNKVISFICIALFIAIIVLVTWQVTSRYVVGKPSTVTEELARYSFVWLVFFGSSLVIGQRGHMAITFLKDLAPKKYQRILSTLSNLLVIIFVLFVLGYGGLTLAHRSMNQLSASLQIPVGYLYIVMPVNAFLMIFYSVLNIIGDFNHHPITEADYNES